MNRVPLRESGKKTTDSLERRVNLLTGLVIAQIVLLVVFMVVEWTPEMPSLASDAGSKVVAENENAVDLNQVEPVVETRENGELPPEVPATRPIRVEILNGCGVAKLASEYADLLRSRGYDVRDTRNADNTNYQYTLIYDRTQIRGQVGKLGSMMGIKSGNTFVRANPQLVDVDLTIILGKDYSTLKLQP